MKAACRHSPIFRIIAGLILTTFIFYDVSWASQGTAAQIFQGVSQSLSLPNIPVEAGHIESVTRDSNLKNATLIYHIQDAHSVYEAQKNLSNIVEALIQEEGVSLVLVEGGSGDVSLDSLRKIAWKPVRRRVAEQFLKEGKISGEEFLDVSSNYPITLLGIEYPKLYHENLEVYLKAIRRKPYAEKALAQIGSMIRSREAIIYPSEFRRLEALRVKWQEKQSDLLTYVFALRNLCRDQQINLRLYSEWSKLEGLEKGINVASFDQDHFFNDLGSIETKVREKMLRTQEAKTLWQLSRRFTLLEHLFSLELTSKEYSELTREKEEKQIRKLLEQILSLSGSAPSRISSLLDQLEKEAPVFFKFYELAQARDQVFAQNIERVIREKHPKNLVLITGGFHSDGLSRLFEEKGISRVLISPVISEVDKKSEGIYERIMREKSKSTLRAPATLGTPFFFELKSVLEREQAHVLHDHIERLIGYLDIDQYLPGHAQAAGPRATSKSRSELRNDFVHSLFGFMDFSNTGTAPQWILLAAGGALAAGIGIATYFLLKRKKIQPAPAIVAPAEETVSPVVELPENFEPVPDFEEPPQIEEPRSRLTPARVATQNPSVPAKLFAIETRRFFESGMPITPPREDFPPPPYELPLPVPVNAIPADLDARGKVQFILREVLQAMETMDGTMRSHQKETADRALRRMLENGGTPDVAQYRRYLHDDIHNFFRGIFEEMKNIASVPQETAHLPLSEEIEESYPRLPRLVKGLLTENPNLADDPEISDLMKQISRKIGSKPPVAEDIEDYVERSYYRLNGGSPSANGRQKHAASPAKKPKPVAQDRELPTPRREATPHRRPAPRPDSARTNPNHEKLKGQLRDLARMREKLSRDQERLETELGKIEREYRELQESLDEARTQGDRIIEEALRPSIEAYEERLQRLRYNHEELAERIAEITEQETRLQGLLEEGGEEGGARSELRVLDAGLFANSYLVFGAAAGIAMGAVLIFYSLKAWQSNRVSRKLLEANKEDWPFERGRIYKESVSLKEEEKTNLLKNDNAGPFVGLGVFAGWVIGGILLYHAYYTWDWASKVLFEGAENYQGKKEPVTLGALLWLLEIFGAPFIGGFLGYVAAFLIQTITNFATVAYRVLRFPFDYERALKLHLTPFETMDPALLASGSRFLSRLEKSTLEVILQNWVERGEHEKIKAFSEKGVWKGDKERFMALYRDVAGLESAKKLLITSFSKKEEDEESILQVVGEWKAGLDAKKLNGAGLLKDLIPELVKTEKKIGNVKYWIERLTADPLTPWAGGFSQLKIHYEALRALEIKKAEAAKKFSLDVEDARALEAQIKKWQDRIPISEKKSPGAINFLAAILGKVIQTSPAKPWFSMAINKISEIDSAIFKPSKQKEVLARFDQVIGYEMARSTLVTGVSGAEKNTLIAELLSLETHLKTNGIDLPATLTDGLSKLREVSVPERISILGQFRALSPTFYKKDSAQASSAFIALISKESVKTKLARGGAAAKRSMDEIEAKAVLASIEDINNLSGFYTLLAERADTPAQGFLLNLAARAPPAVLPVFIRSRDLLVPYYLSNKTGRDYENLAALAQEYQTRYKGLELLTDALLGILTDPSKSTSQRLDEARKTIASQTLIRIGFPQNVINTWDGVAFEEIVRVVGEIELKKKNSSGSYSEDEMRKEGETLLGRRAGHSVVKKALSKMGRLGLYSFWEGSKPAFYLQFVEDTKGIDPNFFKPGEKLRASYDGSSEPPRKSGSIAPVRHPIGALKQLIVELRKNHANIYDNFIGPKRMLLNGSHLEDVVDDASLMSVAGQMRKKVADWQLSETERTDMVRKVYEIFLSKELQPLLGKETVEEEANYWKEFLRLFAEKSGLKKDNELSRKITAQVRKRIDELAQEAGIGREGVVQFILTRGSISDFVRGEISEDCCAEHRNLHFSDTVALPTDPAFLSFRLVENGKWIGNIYAIILKDENGKFVFYLDNMPVRISHPVTTTQAKADKLVTGFYEKLKPLLEESGFDYFAMASDPSSRENIRTALRALGGTSESKTVTKPGGFGHKSEFDVSSEYIQGLGTLSSSIHANGTWTQLDNRVTRERKRRLEMEEIEQTLSRVQAERKRLEQLKTQKNGRVTHIKGKGQDAAQVLRITTAQILQEVAVKEELDLARIAEEIGGLDRQAVSLKARLEGLRTGSARSELRTPAALFAQIGSGNGVLEFLFFAGLFGLIAWIGWILLRDWLENSRKNNAYTDDSFSAKKTYRKAYEDDPYYRPLPPPVYTPPAWLKHPLVVELAELFKAVLKNVSADLKALIPKRLFFPIGAEVGMELPPHIIRTLTTANISLTAIKDHGSMFGYLQEQPYYQKFKEEAAQLGLNPYFDAPGIISEFQMETKRLEKVYFALEVSERTADDLLRGDVSHDCTALGGCSAFYETIPQFLLDPGFIDLKLRMNGKWVGNIYVMAAKKGNAPALVIDAVQLPPAQVAWPIRPELIAQRVVEEVSKWAESKNFKHVFISRFVSNFHYLHEYFDLRYPPKVTEIEKLGGYEHLKSLGLWDDNAHRNQYIETFSPLWNRPLKGVDPNNPKQKILLRPFWSKETPAEEPSQGARSEMRSFAAQNWTIEGFDFDVSESDLAALSRNGVSQEESSKAILRQALQSKSLGIADAFRAAGYGPGMTIRVRVHDETETERIYKFIIATARGRNNFILYVSPDGAKFRPYSEDLNFVDTALMTGEDHGVVVGFRNIFLKWGEPPDPALQQIPPHGLVFSEEVSEYSKPDRKLKVFDLRIREREKSSLRTAMKPKEKEDIAAELPASKAVYDFKWGGEDYILGIYSPGAPVVLPENLEEKKAAGAESEDEPLLMSAALEGAFNSDQAVRMPGSKPEPVRKNTPAVVTAGPVGAGAGFVRAIVARKREQLFKASQEKIKTLHRSIVLAAKAALEAVERALEPSDLDRLETELAGYSQAMDRDLADIENEVSKYKPETAERVKLEEMKAGVLSDLETLKAGAGVEEATLPALVDLERDREALGVRTAELGRIHDQIATLKGQAERLAVQIQEQTGKVDEAGRTLGEKQNDLAALDVDLGLKTGELEIKTRQSQELDETLIARTRELGELESRKAALTGDIQALQERKRELERVHVELGTIEPQLEEVKRQIAAVETQRDQARQEHERFLQTAGEEKVKLGSLTAQIAAAEEKIGGLREILQDLAQKEQERARILAETEDLNRQIETKTAALGELASRISESEAQVLELERRRKTLNDEIFQARQILSGIQSERQQAETDLGRIRETLAQAREQLTPLSELESRLAAVKRELAEHESLGPKIEEAKREFAQAISGREEAQRRYDELIESNAGEQEKYELLKTQISEAEERMRALQGQIQSLEESERKQAELSRALETLEQDIRGRQAHYENLRRQISDAEVAIAEREERKQTLERELLEKERALEELNGKHRAAEETLREIQGALERAREQLTSLPEKERRLLEVTSELGQKESDLLSKADQIRRADDQIQEKESMAHDLERQIQVHTTGLEQKTRELQTLDESLSGKRRETQELEERGASLRVEIEGLEVKKRSLETELGEMASVKTQLAENKTELEEIKRRQGKAHAEYERITALSGAETEKVASLKTKVRRLDGEVAALEEKLGDLQEKEERKEALLREIEDLNAQISEKTGTLGNLGTQAGEVSARHGRVLEETETLARELSAKSDELASLKEEIIQTRRTLDEQTGELGRLREDLAALSRDLEEKGGELRTRAGESAALDEKIAGQTSELARLEETRTRLLGESATLEDQRRQLEDLRTKLVGEQSAWQGAEQGLEEEKRKAQDAIQSLGAQLRTVGERLKETMAALSENEQETARLRLQFETEKAGSEQANARAEELKGERDQFEGDLIHAREEIDTLEEALRQAKKTTTTAGGSEVALDGYESLEVLLAELPQNLWTVLGKHFPGQDRRGFQLAVKSVATQLVEAWNRSPFFRKIIKNLVLYRNHYDWFQKQPFYREFKRESQALGLNADFDKPGERVHFKVPGDERNYALELSKRDIEYLLRGFFSGDCTNCGPGYVTASFLTATGSHITDPGFFNFKILRDGEWIGNVYAMAIRENGKPVLVIDAMQIPWQSASPLFIPFDLSQSRFPVETEKDVLALAEAAMGALGQYSDEAGYQELWLSSFVSNFSALKSYFYMRHQAEFDRHVTGEAKIGGWNALKALGYEGRPYVESIGHPEAKKIWERTPHAKEQVTPPPADLKGKEKEETVAVAGDGVQKTGPDVSGVVQQIKESVDFSYHGVMTRGMEFIVRVPGAPLRWIAFDEATREWKLYESDHGKVKSFPLLEKGTGVRQQAGTININQVEVELPQGKAALPQFLRLPPLKKGQLETYLEEGGAVMARNGQITVIPFSKKGFIVDGVRGAFFVHPGDASLDRKENVSLPLANHYESLKQKNPGARFILGWHTNPGGEPSLHDEEEREIVGAGAEGFQLVASPKGISLVQYSRSNGQWKKKNIFTRRLNEDWLRELEAALNQSLGNGKEDSLASGYQLKQHERDLLAEALERGQKTNPRNIKSQVQKLYFDLGTAYGLETPGLESFIENSDFKLVVVQPQRLQGQRAPPMGIGLDLGKPGRDVYATFELTRKEEGQGFEVTIYVGHGIYELAGEKERLEIIAHEFYQAFRKAHDLIPRVYPFDIDLELKIDEEIRSAQGWESQIPQTEREDLGLIGGPENRTDAHVRARAFARLIGTPSVEGKGTTYTDLLRRAYALARRFSQEHTLRDHADTVPPLAEDAFRYTQDSFQNVVSPEGLQRLFEMSAYVQEHKEEDLVAFLGRKIEEGRRVLVLNANAPTPWILKDVKKIIEGLAGEDKLAHVFIDLPPALQPLINNYLETGRVPQGLLEAIAKRFPPFLPREFQRPDLYENILRAVYEYNLEARNGKKIQVTAYYKGRQLPPMPGAPGNFPPRPGNRPLPGNAEPPFQAPPFMPRGAEPPIMPRPGEFPFPSGMTLPPLPLTAGVKEAFQKAVSEVQRNPEAVALFLKPLDEFLPDELSERPEVASILHIDKYTGFGPEKPENQLALYMSEQASPNQKSFALPIYNEAPFYEEAVNPGVPNGLLFNQFHAYPDLILSTAGEGDDNLETTPDEVQPEEVGPFVPVGSGSRSEIRLHPNPIAAKLRHAPKNVLDERQNAIRELVQIGKPTIGPLVEALKLPSLSLKLGAIEALGAIGNPGVITPLNQVSDAVELREAAKAAIESIHIRQKTEDGKGTKEKSPAAERASAVPAQIRIPSSFDLSAMSKENPGGKGESLSFIRSLLQETPLVVDLDAASLVEKKNGRVRLIGWGFIETLKALETELPSELLGRIRIRVLNLNPDLRPREIEQAFGITPELRGVLEIQNVPVRNTAFKGLSLYLRKDSLKIASEINRPLWKSGVDILVKKPAASELIDGRKLFLTALLHRALGFRISKELKAAVVRLLREIGDLPLNGISYFNADSRTAFSLEFLDQMDQVNRMLASMA